MKLYLPPFPMNSARKQLSWMWSFLTLLCFSANMMFANDYNAPTVGCQMGCEDSINLTLDENCEGEITVSMMLKDSTGCGPSLPLALYIVTPAGDTLNSNIVGKDHVGMLLTVTVYDPGSGQSCWGEILVEDKHIEDLFCRNDTFDCSINPTPGNTFFPFDPNWDAVATPVQGADPDLGPWNVSNYDSCGNAVLTLRERSTTSNCGLYNKTIFRTWEIVDGYGNDATCMDTIYLRNPGVTSINWPANVVLDCEDRRDDTQQGNCGNILGWNVIKNRTLRGSPLT